MSVSIYQHGKGVYLINEFYNVDSFLHEIIDELMVCIQ